MVMIRRVEDALWSYRGNLATEPEGIRRAILSGASTGFLKLGLAELGELLEKKGLAPLSSMERQRLGLGAYGQGPSHPAGATASAGGAAGALLSLGPRALQSRRFPPIEVAPSRRRLLALELRAAAKAAGVELDVVEYSELRPLEVEVQGSAARLLQFEREFLRLAEGR